MNFEKLLSKYIKKKDFFEKKIDKTKNKKDYEQIKRLFEDVDQLGLQIKEKIQNLSGPVDADLKAKFYEFKKKNPISKDAIDKRKEKDEQFERFKAEYYRLKSIKS